MNEHVCNTTEFLGHLKEELINKTTLFIKKIKLYNLNVKMLMHFMQSPEGQIDPRFEEFEHIDNAEDLIDYIKSNGKMNLVICGLHYGKCVTTTATILLDAKNTRRTY